MAKNDIKKYINIFITVTGNTYKIMANVPLYLYFKSILDKVVPNVNPLKNIITITAKIPIIDIPRTNIINNWVKLFNSILKKAEEPNTSLDNFLILLKNTVTCDINNFLS